MKAQPCKLVDGRYKNCSIEEITHLKIKIPGPTGLSILPVITKGNKINSPCWNWNKDTDFPTLNPSIITTSSYDGTDHICHCFITRGKVMFLSDCTHKYANQTLDVLELDNK